MLLSSLIVAAFVLGFLLLSGMQVIAMRRGTIGQY